MYALGSDGKLTTVRSGEPGGSLLGIGAAADGTLYIALPDAHRVDRVEPDGTVSTFAGTGTDAVDGAADGPVEADPDQLGDGGPAAEAVLRAPNDVAVGPDGSVYISSRDGIRRVDSTGDITSLDGFDIESSSGDTPIDISWSAITMDPYGNLYAADERNDQVWVVVRPGEIEDGGRLGSWGVWAVAAVVVVLVGGSGLFFFLRRRRRRRADPAPNVAGV